MNNIWFWCLLISSLNIRESQNKCPTGKYKLTTKAKTCEGICHCLKPANCQENGICVGKKCEAGKQGAKCQNDCTNQKWGLECKTDCHCIDKSKQCHVQTGACATCHLRYTGKACQTTCFDIYKWWKNKGCNGTCHCLDKKLCNVTDGSCADNECHSGYIGAKCQDECSPGAWGKKCLEPCKCFGKATCNIETGACNACSPRTTGKACQKKCLAGKYDYPACHEQCHCEIPTNCRVTDGVCVHGGCETGYRGSACQQVCPVGKFGPGCQKDCHCVKNQTCSTVSGTCPSVCHARWTGPSCQKNCEAGLYGANCKNTCHCRKQDDCSVVNGDCGDRGCAVGYTGAGCQSSCTSGTYGESCIHQCNCRNKAVCDISTGACPGGCKAGYNGTSCQNECKLMFGYGCSDDCHCLNDEQCERVTGKCQAGCHYRYSGPKCQKTCKYGHFGIPDCKEVCDCAVLDSCRVTDGFCESSKCINERYTGSNCKQTCKIETFMQDGKCTGSCRCSDPYKCRVVDGTCVGTPCRPGWYGPDCQKGCGANNWGKLCKRKCFCKKKRPCHHLTGRCKGGCDVGYSGIYCQYYENIQDIKLKTSLWATGILFLVVVASASLYLIKQRQKSEKKKRKKEMEADGSNIKSIVSEHNDTNVSPVARKFSIKIG